MDGETARIADIGDMVEQLQRVDEGAAGFRAALQFKAYQRSIAALEIFVGAPTLLARLQGGMDHLHDLGALAQP